jgi:hypothetical protein
MNSKIILLLNKYKSGIAAFILSLYCLPYAFRAPISTTIDGAWESALNFSIAKKLTFGDQYVFTYGPLGFLSTRIGLYVSSIEFWVFDLFLFLGFYHLLYKFISGAKGWLWLVIVFFALAYMRTSNVAQVLFFLFAIYFCLNLLNKFSSYIELTCTALSGVLLFYIKINYGLVALPLLLLFGLLLLAKNRARFLIFAGITLCSFGIIAFCTHINVINYTKYGYELLAHFDEALYQSIGPYQFPFLLAVILILLLTGTLILSVIRLIKMREISSDKIICILILAGSCFLFYRNGFTRADLHWREFFAIFPVLIVATVFLFGTSKLLFSKIAAIFSILVCYYSYVYRVADDKLLPVTVENLSGFPDIFSLRDYFFCQSGDYDNNILVTTLPGDKRDLLGQHTVDVFPYDDLLLLHFNELNYLPRPITEAYTRSLDELNADHFCDKNRKPDFLLLQNYSFDSRYAFWDESVTKAAISLNYNYISFIEPHGDSIGPNSTLILRSKQDAQVHPVFDKIRQVTINMDDGYPIVFPDSEAIYMEADVRYSLWGKINRLLGNVPELSIILFFDNGAGQHDRAVCPIISGPVLINKTVRNSIELRNFFNRRLKYNRNITGFTFSPVTSGFEPEISVTFLKFSNY